MTYEHFEHEADVGIRGKGKTIEKAFEEAAKAMFDVEVDVDKVKALKKINIECQASNIEELFVEWLNALLSQASIHGMVFSKFKAKIIKDRKNKILKVEGQAIGEKFDAKKHNAKDEVKGATYSQLKVYQDKKTKKWMAQCVVDV
ncbi:MAG: archease [Candidatus Pacearchaeota archaeon]|nr:archease [Candidatus Pacearchaeota archaeon]